LESHALKKNVKKKQDGLNGCIYELNSTNQ